METQRNSQRHRRLTLQARKDKEKSVVRQARERQERMSKQKEIEVHTLYCIHCTPSFHVILYLQVREMRRSRLARQREEENQIKARERTQQLVRQLQKQEVERDRIMRLRQHEMERAEQLRKPTEDLLLTDLPKAHSLTKLEWVSISSQAFAELIMVFEFTVSFEEFLDLDCTPKFWDLYAGLYNISLIPTTEGGEETEPLPYVLVQIMKSLTIDPAGKVHH